MDFSRRNLFNLGGKELARSLLSAFAELGAVRADEPKHGTKPAFLRPPGAPDEETFLDTCTRCDACIKACPKWSIRRAGIELGARIEGTPVILPETNPCYLCADMPCIAACEPEALQPVASPEDVRMGTARVDTGLCYSASGSICEVCEERCPARPRAILLVRGEAPKIRVDRCTGCGICAYLCPPNALRITR